MTMGVQRSLAVWSDLLSGWMCRLLPKWWQKLS